MDPSTLDAARAGKRQAVVQVLAERLPEVWRMAVNLAGTEERGRAIVRDVMKRGQLAMETFEHVDAPTRWFRHHTILAVRQGTLPPPGEADALLAHPPAEVLRPQYRAIVTALRKLPQQQIEAFVLHHGEGFDARKLGIAMDCSVEAAANHLRQAQEALAPLAGTAWPVLQGAVTNAYRATAPSGDVAVPLAKRRLSKAWRRRLTAAGLFIGWALILLLCAVAVVVVFTLWGRVEV